MELHLKIKNPIVNEWLSTLTGPSPITFAPKTSKEAKKHDEKRAERKSAVAAAPASVPNAPSSSSKRPLPSSSKVDEKEAPVLKKPVLWKAVTPKFSGRYLGERPEDVDRLVSPPWLPSLPKIGSLRVEKGKVQPVECGVAEMTDSTQLFKSGQHTELLQRFKDDGYLFLRGIVPLDAVSSSQRKVTRLIDRLGWTKHAKGPAKKGQVGATIEAYSGLNISGTRTHAGTQLRKHKLLWRQVGTSPAMVRTFSGPELQEVMNALATAATQDCDTMYQATALSHFTWLRVKAPGEMTPEHVDFYHLSEASDLYYPGKTSMAAAGGKTATSKSGPVAADSDDDSQSESPESPVDCPKCGPKRPADQFLMCDECNTVCHMKCLVPPLKSVPEGDWYCDDCMPRPLIMTSWIPLTDVGAEHGGLCILVGSHEYGGLDEEGKIPYSQCPKTLKTKGRNRVWVTTNFKAGDVVIFDVRTIHATGTNNDINFRLSVDTRWSVYPLRLNFGSTLSSQCILRQGVPNDGLVVSSDDEVYASDESDADAEPVDSEEEARVSAASKLVKGETSA